MLTHFFHRQRTHTPTPIQEKRKMKIRNECVYLTPHFLMWRAFTILLKCIQHEYYMDMYTSTTVQYTYII